jgi:hypothetical protein
MINSKGIFLKFVSTIYFLLKNELLKRGFLLKRATKARDLSLLIGRLTPWDCGINLIRIGGDGDGGYVLPDDLDGIVACFSPGVSDSAAFEEELAQKFQIESHLADYSVEGPPGFFTPKSFIKKFVGVYNSESMITMSDWVTGRAQNSETGDYLLQMDIEGDEYKTIIATPQDVLTKFRIIVLEIHGFENWADPVFFKHVLSFFEKLFLSFTVVHIHANNCCGRSNLFGVEFPNVFEMTLIRNDRYDKKDLFSSIDTSLDRDNVRKNPTINISDYLNFK